MTPELFCFLTSVLCALLLFGIEGYHTLTIKYYSGTVLPIIEGFVAKAYDDQTIGNGCEMNPTDMV